MGDPLTADDPEQETPPETPRPGQMPDAPWAADIVVGTCRTCHRPNNSHAPYCVHANDSAD